MDQRENGLEPSDPATQAREIEQEVDAIRDDLGELVGELDRRRHRATRPLLMGAAAIAVATAGIAGVVLWRQHVNRRARQTALGFVRTLFGIA